MNPLICYCEELDILIDLDWNLAGGHWMSAYDETCISDQAKLQFKYFGLGAHYDWVIIGEL